MIKLAEVYFNHASWQLNQEDGQLAIADVAFTNFRYWTSFAQTTLVLASKNAFTIEAVIDTLFLAFVLPCSHA